MRIAVVSCWKYRDAWKPFFDLLEKFWPNRPYGADLISDEIPDLGWTNGIKAWPRSVRPGGAWCESLVKITSKPEEKWLVLQEDFFLNAPVNQALIDHALKLMERESIGAIRLYPCPGATEPSDDPYFGPVARHTMYRNSLQATIYRPGYLKAIAERYSTPQEFELQGSPWASSHLPAEVWAFKRELMPLLPISYICTGIVNGVWQRGALELCAQHGIEVDTSMRGVA